MKLPNIYIAQAIACMCILLAGAIGSVTAVEGLPYYACALTEICLIPLLAKAIRHRDVRYACILGATMVCIAGIAALIVNILCRLEAIS